MGGSNSGRARIRPHLGMFLRLNARNVADVPKGTTVILMWSGSATVAVKGAGHGVELHFAKDGEPVTQFVFVDRVPCHFGGARPVLCCPKCWRHCRSLYLYGWRFICRLCTRARYWTQTASPDARMARRIRQIQGRLAPDDDPDDYTIDWLPARPKGMRRRTYERLAEKMVAVVDKRDAYLEPGLLRLLARYSSPEMLAELLGEELAD